MRYVGSGVAVERNPFVANVLHVNPLLMFLFTVGTTILVYMASRVEPRVAWFVAGFTTAKLTFIAYQS